MRSPTRILCVDDDLDNNFVLQELLRDMGYDVAGAGSGDEALRYLYSEQFDAMISDVSMPGMSGIELARRAADARPGLPVILLTGNPDAMNSALASGLVAIPKPVEPSRLSQVLGDAFGNSMR